MSYTVSREALEEAVLQADLDPERAVREDYSGRGMYGESCLGLVYASLGELLRFGVALLGEDADASDWIDNVRQDNMGLSMIAYWPSVTVVECKDEDEDFPA